jgi:hypothetical protein
MFCTKFASPARPTLTQSAAGKHGKARGAGRREKPEYQAYTLRQIQEHNTPEDCWIIVDGKVHDVSTFNHPGKQRGAILRPSFLPSYPTTYDVQPYLAYERLQLRFLPRICATASKSGRLCQVNL